MPMVSEKSIVEIIPCAGCGQAPGSRLLCGWSELGFSNPQGEMHMPHMTRRQLLQAAGASAAALALAPLTRATAGAADEKKAAAGFTLPPLPYGYDALAPSISEKTMKFHHDS